MKLDTTKRLVTGLVLFATGVAQAQQVPQFSGTFGNLVDPEIRSPNIASQPFGVAKGNVAFFSYAHAFGIGKKKP